MKKLLIVAFVLFLLVVIVLYLSSTETKLSRPANVSKPVNKSVQASRQHSDVTAASELESNIKRWLNSGMQFHSRPDDIETSGFNLLINVTEPWEPGSDLKEIAETFENPGPKMRLQMDRFLQSGQASPPQIVETNILKAASYQMEGNPEEAYKILSQLRGMIESNPEGARLFLFPVIYLQGVAGLRIGENANCVMCRGESSCIIPISKEAVHKDRKGSLLAIKHFSEYLAAFPKI